MGAPSRQKKFKSEGGSLLVHAPGHGPAARRLRTMWRPLAEKSLPTHARDKTSPRAEGPPILCLGPGADSLRPKAVCTSSGGGFRTPLGRNNRGTWGSGRS